MDSHELRQRLGALGYTQRRAAEKLGLSVEGLAKQLYGARPVSRQTAIIVELLEHIERPEIVRARAQQEANRGLIEHLSGTAAGHRPAPPPPPRIPPAGQ
jgi:hypothetical protein